MSELEHEKTRMEPSLQTRWSLIGRLKDWGDQQSWQEFFDTYWKLIYRTTETRILRSSADDTARTSTIDRIPDPAGLALEAFWNEEWEKNLLAAAAERVKHQVDPEQYQLFDFHVLKKWPAQKVARKLGVNLGKVYSAKYKVSALLRKEIKVLERKII